MTPVVIVAVFLTSTGYFAMTQTIVPPQEQPFLRALGELESGNNDHAVGMLGERSRYQFRKDTWKEVSNRPFSFAYKTEFATAAAMTYINVLSNRFYTKTGKRPTELDYYIMWNWGFAKYERAKFNTYKVPREVRDAAFRFSNLVFKYSNNN